MRKSLFLLLILLFTVPAISQNRCNSCNGQGKFICKVCSGYGMVYSNIWNPYIGCYQQIATACNNCGGYGAFTCNTCGGRGYINSVGPSFKGKWINVSVNTPKCAGYAGSLCSCRRFIGQRLAGTDYYKGSCSNYINGHRCGHGPGAHGLKEY